MEKKEIKSPFTEIAQQIHKCIKLKKLSCAIETFTCVGLPLNKKLMIKYYKEVGEEKKSRPEIVNLQNNSTDTDIFKYLWVEDSEMGAWQAFILHTLWRVLPQARYQDQVRTYIFCKEDISYNEEVEDYDEDKWYLRDKIPYRIYKQEEEFFTPKIKKDGEYYRIECYYWSEYEGFIRERVLIKIKDQHVTQILDLDPTTLYKYNCEEDWWVYK